MGVASAILLFVAAYAALGVLVGLAFVLVALPTVDTAAAGGGAPWHFRLVILPGAVVLWPVVLRWWLRARFRKDPSP